MQMENDVKSTKRVKVDDSAEIVHEKKETSTTQEKSKSESLADAAAKALEALKAMKNKKNENTVKENVTFAGGAYEIEREKTMNEWIYLAIKIR